MHIEAKAPVVEEGKSSSLCLLASGSNEKPTHQKSVSTPYDLKSIITEKVRMDSRYAFGAQRDGDVNWTLLSRCSSESNLPKVTMNGLRDAYDNLLQREGDLSHALSRTQMELEETQTMFEQAVALGEQLREEKRDLNEKLTEQIDFTSLLKKQIRFHEESNSILSSTLGEARKTEQESQKALRVAENSTSLVKLELNQQKEYSNRIEDEYIEAQTNYDSCLNSALEALQKKLLDEEAKLSDSLEEAAATKNKLRDTEHRLSQVNSKLASVERKLVEKQSIYSEMVLGLKAEKATLKAANNALIEDLKIVEEQLKEKNERLRYYQRRSVFLEPL